MSGRGQRPDQKQSANVYDRAEQERIGAPRGVAPKKITGSPRHHGSHTVNSSGELGSSSHARRA